MSLTKTPICDFGKKANDFRLKSTENKILSLNELKGEKGTLIMFICNHCPYVKAVIKDIAEDCKKLENAYYNNKPLQDEKDRTDYILYSPGVSQSVQVFWKRDKELLKLSDHYPLIANLLDDQNNSTS